MEVKGCKICSPEKNDSSQAKDGEHQFRRDGTRCKANSSSINVKKQHTVRRTHFSEKLELECDEAQIQEPSFLHNWRTPDRVEAAAASASSAGGAGGAIGRVRLSYPSRGFYEYAPCPHCYAPWP